MLGARPLPPVSVPVKVVVGAGAGTSDRSVTGIVVTAANPGWLAELRSTIAPASSPGWLGVLTFSVKLLDAPGARVIECLVSEPKDVNLDVVARNGALMLDGGLVLLGKAATSAVQVPGAGLATWVLP